VTWSRTIKLHEVDRGAVRVRLEPGADERAEIARRLGLQSLPALTAEVTVKRWLDGVEVVGRFDAVVEQVCGVTLEPFEQPVSGEFEVRAVPAGSPHAAAVEGGELELDAEAPDAPDVLEADAIDVAAYVVEHLALELDPFPRKPGVSFDYEPPETDGSPFAVLKNLKEPKA
jgi:uncharacterized metal-binding protein YceD (DUF177 family)